MCGIEWPLHWTGATFLIDANHESGSLARGFENLGSIRYFMEFFCPLLDNKLTFPRFSGRMPQLYWFRASGAFFNRPGRPGPIVGRPLKQRFRKAIINEERNSWQ